MSSRFEAFVISMKGNASRRAQVERIVAACPVPCTVIDAVDGRVMSDEERGVVYARQLHAPRYPFELRPGEIGCFLSHRRVWQTILDRDLDGAAIFEDDVSLEQPGFGRALEVAVEALSVADLVRLRLMHRTSHARRARKESLVEWPTVTPLGTQAQVVGREGARLLLAGSVRFDRPVDVYLQMRWLSGIAACEVAPSHVFDLTAGLGGSIIQSRGRGVFSQISRNLARTAYRARIRCISFMRPPRPRSEGSER